jgi:Glycosyl-4,4'-diaponeurosporenoate acyltransferase
MLYKYLSFSIAITFISFVVGIAVNAVLKKTKFYNTELSNLNFIRSDMLNKWFGVDLVRWTVKNTPFKYLNQKLTLNGKIEKAGLHKLRQEMTSSEIDHLIGFVFVAIFALVKFYKTEWLFGLTIMIVNILMNLNPSLLQQQNKRRIDKLIKKLQLKQKYL